MRAGWGKVARAALGSALCGLAGCQAAPREPTRLLHVFAGGEAIRNETTVLAVGAEYQFRPQTALSLRPALGLLLLDGRAIYVYGGVRYEGWLGEHWLLTPGFSIGRFESSTDFDLGFELEFRSGLELSYCFANDVRIGLGIFHTSNADLSEDNPGAESVALSIGLPLR